MQDKSPRLLRPKEKPSYGSGWRCYRAEEQLALVVSHASTCAVEISEYSTTLIVLAVTLRNDADQLSRLRFGNYFGGTVGLLADAVANKTGVGNADETVVDA